jgi:hypothetical protein
MTEEQIALSRRAVACKGWKWMAGMRTTEGYRVLAPWRDTLTVAKGTLVYTLTEREGGWLWHWYDPAVDGSEEDESGALLPDLLDAATLGCLLALVREAWNDQRAYMRASFGWEWITDYCVEKWPPGGETEAQALVAALEAALNVSGEHRRTEKETTP